MPRGASTSCFRVPSLWWLESYPKFAQHLHRHYPLVLDDPGDVRDILLERYSAADPSAWKARIGRLIEEYAAEAGMEPSVLDWNTGLELQELFPNQAVFSPPTPDRELPYLDATADVVVVASPERGRAARGSSRGGACWS